MSKKAWFLLWLIIVQLFGLAIAAQHVKSAENHWFGIGFGVVLGLTFAQGLALVVQEDDHE